MRIVLALFISFFIVAIVLGATWWTLAQTMETLMTRLKTLALNVLVTALTVAACYGVYLGYVQWTRVDALWTWASGIQAQANAQNQVARPQPTPKEGAK